MKKKLACMLLMSALALSMTACGGKDNNGAASDNQQSTMESTAAGQETGEAGSTTAATRIRRTLRKRYRVQKRQLRMHWETITGRIPRYPGKC